MTQAFARIPANVIEDFINGRTDIPDALLMALEKAVHTARNDPNNYEACIEVFITDDTEDADD